MKLKIMLLLAALSLPVSAQVPAPQALSEGEVRRIDKGTGKITLHHGEIRNLDMPPMTMVFQATDPAVLDALKVGDKVRFQAEEKSGAYFVTRIERAN